MKSRTLALLKIAVVLLALITGLTLKTFSQCDANFNWTQTANNTIQCTNTSTGWNFYTSYTYYWGDGTLTDNLVVGDTPHVYLNPGTYWVCMQMFDGYNLCDSFCTNVTITGCTPGANFILYPDTLLPHHYYVEDLSIGIPPNNYYWNWDDGTFDTIPFPSHTYAVEYVYNICLTTTDSSGCVSTYCNSYSLERMSSAEGENTMVYVQVIGFATSIHNPEVLQSLSVLPNPVSGKAAINFSLSLDALMNMNIYDVMGTKQHTLVNAQESSGDHNITMDVTNLSNGIYILQIHVGGRIISKKIAVVN